ncbi:MAG: tetratricopeptide repeat protein [Prevotella sp.]|nr:tetratricopeptide repeat protein [Prevotella sp.]
MSIQELIQHPELMNRETLYELRRITAEHPYYQTARLLLLKNLYLLHDSTFDEELRRSAIYITDRRVLFNLVEAAHYRLKRKSPQSFTNKPDRRAAVAQEDDSRTVSLIDTFLSTIPEEDELKKEKKEEHRKPTAVDATTDYVAYLLSTDFEELDNGNDNVNVNQTSQESDDKEDVPVPINVPVSKTDDLIDAFINSEGKITLQEELEYTPEQEEEGDGDEMTSDEYLTETLAGIYIKQKRYKKALDIMEKVNEKANSNNKYYEDQKRFLELIIANSK